MKAHQGGLTLLEMLVALALTAVLGVLLATLVNGWLQTRERLQSLDAGPQVLEFCMALERHFDGLQLRQLYDQRLPRKLNWLDWQPGSQQLEWVAASNWPNSANASRLQRLRLAYEPARQRLTLWQSADLYAAATPIWAQALLLPGVERVDFSFYQGQRWQAFPSTTLAQPDRGVRLQLQRQGEPYVCTFALPDSRP
ncbi:prepilin-type N-terminal cleavage/methylation domain-containing protein [Pseudomonas sp. R5(2019)]|uniref:prepilin-type N-terminal cleavage/methylation domain-containing protein n=1 Tax=Pseudomonas sp. R5(2019) TaxID=2697566 RepID=UPI001412CC16|nr:prepilin-type N-terminal cleavage/methylation domain-containing protein [Pseudomonas sp. R5(2019)]NBA98001.1 prepilin-type N-terminal cleavage/methylation domain-containing protein [Pseudomonas sp. R5(2019)]